MRYLYLESRRRMRWEEEEAVAKYVVGDTHAGLVVPPLSRYHIVSRTSP